MKHKFLFICTMISLMLFMPMSILANNFDANEVGSISITLTNHDDNSPIAGVEFSLYHVATVKTDEAGNLLYRYTSDFESCETKLNDPSITMALDSFVGNHSLSSNKFITNSQGKAKIENLPLGLYFVKQTNTLEGYAPCTSFLVTVPMKTEEGYVYNVNASPKVDIFRAVDITVKKVWNTDESTKITDFVTIQLLKNKETVETVILNEENNWEHTFYDMPKSDAYSIVEVNIPKGFTATYKKNGYVFTVTNTSSLIHTGQLIWPIPILFVLGLGLVAVGSVILTKTRVQDE